MQERKLLIRCSDVLYRKVKEQAKQRGMNISQYIKVILTESLIIGGGEND